MIQFNGRLSISDRRCIVNTKRKIKSEAVRLIKQAKKDKKIPEIAAAIVFENKKQNIKNIESWFYKVASDAINPSLERSMDVVEYFEKAAA